MSWSAILQNNDTFYNNECLYFSCRSPIVCDLCDVELSNGQELQHHLEGKTHWDTLEHIQQENNYDDLAIAFLQVR